MNRRVRRLKKDLERAGGTVEIPKDMPDDVARFFLEEIMNCPDCMRDLANARIPPGKREH